MKNKELTTDDIEMMQVMIRTNDGRAFIAVIENSLEKNIIASLSKFIELDTEGIGTTTVSEIIKK